MREPVSDTSGQSQHRDAARVFPRFASIADMARRQAQAYPDKIVLIAPGWRWTFAELDQVSNRIANGLRAAGIGPGDTVSVLTRHVGICMALLCAAAKIGAIVAALNWRLSPDELTDVIGRASSKFLVVDEEFEAKLSGIALPDVRMKLTTEPDGRRSLFAWARTQEPTDPGHVPSPDDSALKMFSSGTTGFPKIVDLSHDNLLQQCAGWSPLFGYAECKTVHLNVLPTFHVSGIVNALWMMYLGSTCVAIPEFVPLEFLRTIEQHRVTDLFAVPAMLQALLAVDELDEIDLSSLRSIGYGGSPITAELLRRSMQAFDSVFLQIYGATECSGTITLLAGSDHARSAEPALLRSVGKPAPHIELRIVDPQTLEDCAEGVAGEIWVRSRQNMKGYAHDPEATAAVFPAGRDPAGGWYRSGDGGVIEKGYLYLRDRIKDMIISGGENIYPAEVERVVLQYPGISEVSVIGVPDPTWGEVGKACVVCAPGVELDERAVIAFCRARLAHYKCPKSLDVLAELPRNASGKILKRILRAPYVGDR